MLPTYLNYFINICIIFHRFYVYITNKTLKLKEIYIIGDN